MLVLSRKKGERIQIGEDITVIINNISGKQVSIAIDAPKGVHILRTELKGDANGKRDTK